MTRIPLLAIDGGGSHCRAALCDLQGNVLDYVTGGPCNYQSIGADEACRNLAGVLGRLTNHGDQELRVQQAVIGIAGLDTGNDRVIIEQFVRESFRQAKVEVDELSVYNDAMVTLFGSIQDGAGILVVSGTGSVVYGKAKNGPQVRVGGWGHRIGDDGSGYAIGNTALRHVFRAFDGCEPTSDITNEVLQELGLDTIADLLTWIYSARYSVERVASLAPLVFRLAHAGDSTASEMLRQAGNDLAFACTVVIDQLQLGDTVFDIVMAGGILQKDVFVRNQMVSILKERFTNFRVIESHHEPIYNAMLHGLRNLGQSFEDVAVRCSEALHRWQMQMTQ